MTIQKIEPERYFTFTWHPYALDIKRDYSKEATTLVAFRLIEVEHGTQLVLTESGFDKLPSDRINEAFEKNDKGWDEQMKNIKRYIESE